MTIKRLKINTCVILAAFLLVSAALPFRSFAGENIPVTIDIPVTYIVNGNDETSGGDRFTLMPDDPRAPMPEGTSDGKKTIDIRQEGSCSFGNIKYDRPEVWWYTVSRELTEKKGVSKDDSIYRVKVIALNDGHGYVLAYLDGSDDKHELVYTDRVAPDTGDSGTIVLSTAMTLMAAAGLLFLALARSRSRKKEV